jgi:hypothetical protein
LSINDVGKEGERQARLIAKTWGVEKIFQPDWITMKNGQWVVWEVKHKSMFKAPPFDGHGLNAYQADMRIEFYKIFGLRCLFFVIDKDTNRIYWAWLDELEQGRKFETKNGVRIYPLVNFHEVTNPLLNKS